MSCLLAFAILFSAQEVQKQCWTCHMKEGGHANAPGKCGTCGLEAGGCCAPSHCYTGICRTCGKTGTTHLDRMVEALGDAAKRDDAAKAIEGIGAKAVPALKKALEKAEGATRDVIRALLDALDWPEGGKIVDGLRITLKAVEEKVKTGGAIELRVRITNTTGKEWTRQFKKHDTGFEKHLQWVAARDRAIADVPLSASCCPSSHVGEPGTLKLTIATGASETFTIKGEPPRLTKLGGKGKIADEPGTWTLRVTETLVGLTSNEVKIVVEK